LPVSDKILYWQHSQHFSELLGLLQIGLFEAKLYLRACILFVLPTLSDLFEIQCDICT